MEENRIRLDQESLEKVTGGEWVGFPPGTTCPLCQKGTLVAEDDGRDKDGADHYAVCDRCGRRRVYRWRFSS